MINAAQVFLLSLVALIMGLVILRHRQRKIGTFALLFWLFLWTGAAVIILFPNSTMVVANFLGIGRGSDLILYLSVILIFYLLFRLYVRLEQMDQGITQIVRALALRDAGLTHSGDEQDKIFQPRDQKL